MYTTEKNFKSFESRLPPYLKVGVTSFFLIFIVVNLFIYWFTNKFIYLPVNLFIYWLPIYWLISSVVLVSGVHRSKSIMHIPRSTLFFTFSHKGHYRLLSRVLWALQ